MTVTVATGITPPVTLLTVPTILPVTLAKALAAVKQTTQTAKTTSSFQTSLRPDITGRETLTGIKPVAEPAADNCPTKPAFFCDKYHA
jgi:hypothetical protein